MGVVEGDMAPFMRPSLLLSLAVNQETALLRAPSLNIVAIP